MKQAIFLLFVSIILVSCGLKKPLENPAVDSKEGVECDCSQDK